MSALSVGYGWGNSPHRLVPQERRERAEMSESAVNIGQNQAQTQVGAALYDNHETSRMIAMGYIWRPWTMGGGEWMLPEPVRLTDADINRIAAAVVRATSECDATIAELRAEIAKLNIANVRLSAANADLHRDVTWRAAEIARMTLAANAWHQT